MSSTAKRYPTQETAHLEVYGHIGTLIAKIKNLSVSGALLEVAQGDYVPQKGDLLSLTVRLDTLQRQHNIAAEVIWSKGFGLGICFIDKGQILERMMAKGAGL